MPDDFGPDFTDDDLPFSDEDPVMHPSPRQKLPPVFDLGGGLVLRSADPDDAESVYAVVDANREHLRTWLPWVDRSRSASDTRAFLEQDAGQRARGVAATFILFLDDELAGFIGLHEIDQINRSFLIGYWLAKRFEGLGLMTRSCRHLLTVAFEQYDMERAVIRCAIGNARSAAIPRRLGFTLEGIERHGQRLHGGFVDLERYSRLRGDS